MSESDTPETDEAYHSSWGHDELVEAAFARDLERRLNEARSALVSLNHPSLNAKDRDDIITGALSKIKPTNQ